MLRLLRLNQLTPEQSFCCPSTDEEPLNLMFKCVNWIHQGPDITTANRERYIPCILHVICCILLQCKGTNYRPVMIIVQTNLSSNWTTNPWVFLQVNWKIWSQYTGHSTGHWCAILTAHQLLWQNMEAPVSIFQESPLAGEPRERLFHIHCIHRCELCPKYLYPSTLLWQMNGCNP